ncbi:MAG: acylphosphatase [Bacteroidota bacterium]|jgi:acylphosphatase
MEVNAKITVKGFVQGVGYRWFADRTARKHQLKGFVENLVNGDVFTEVEGEEMLIKEYINDLKIGPKGAQVKDLVVEWDTARYLFINFKIKA